MKAVRFGKTLKDTFRNLVGMVLPIGVGLFAVPKILHLAGTERFAGLSILWLLVGYASLLDLGFGQSLTKALAEDQVSGVPRSESSVRNWNIQCFLVGIGLAAALLAWPFISLIAPKWIHFSVPLGRELSASGGWVAASLPFVVSVAGLRGAIIAYHAFGQINFARALAGTLNFLVPLAVIMHGGGLEGMAIGLFWVKFLSWMYHIWILHQLLPLRARVRFPSRFELRLLIDMAGWLTVTNLANVAIVGLDRILLGVLISASAITYYSAPYDVLSKLWLIPNAITPVLFPILVKGGVYDRSKLKRVYVVAEGSLIGVMFAVCLGVAILAPWLLRIWLGAEFSSKAGEVASIITIGFFVNTAAHIPFTALQALGYSKRAALFQLIEIPIYAAMLTIGAWMGGLEGVATAFALRMALDAGFFLAQGSHYSGAGRTFTAQVVCLVYAGALVMLLLVKAFTGWWQGLAAVVTLASFYPLWWSFLMKPHGGDLSRMLRREAS